MPQEEEVGVPLVDGLQAAVAPEHVVGEVRSGGVESLEAIELLGLHTFATVFHDMGTGAVGVVVGRPRLHLQPR